MSIKTLPKIDLHCHLDGSIHPEIIFNLLKENNQSLPMSNYNDFVKYVQAPPNCDSLKTYLKRFKYAIDVMQTEKNLEFIASRFVESLAKSKVKYAEVRFAPSFHRQQNLSYDHIIQSVLNGLKQGKDRTGIHVNLIICGMRHESVEENLKIFKVASKYLGYGVVAVDLAGNEADFPPELHKKAFDYANSAGFNITVHAGETGDFSNIDTAITSLHATRIGHGVSAIFNKPTLEKLVKNDITLEVCPTSNIQTKAFLSFSDHPFKSLYDQNVNVTLNTDNMTVSNTDMNMELLIMKETFNLTTEDFMNIYKNSIKASFASKKVKDELMMHLKKES